MGIQRFFSNGTTILETHPKRKTRCYPPKHRRKRSPVNVEEQRVDLSRNQQAGIRSTAREAMYSSRIKKE